MEAPFNRSYIGQRPDVAALVPPSARSILDVGCSVGSLGAFLQERNHARVTGIEHSPSMASHAAQVLHRVIVGDAQEVLTQGELPSRPFDAIIFADVLEHMSDPWTTLQVSLKHLSRHGTIVASIPNVRHFDTIYHLLFRGVWPYRDRGIHDRTHLRFFTRQNIEELFGQAGLCIQELRANYRLIERPHRINRLAPFVAIPGLKPFLAFQYLISARISGNRKPDSSFTRSC